MTTATTLTDVRTAAEELRPALAERAAAHDRDGAFPVADFDAIRSTGLLGLMCPTRNARCGSLQPATSDVCADWLGMSALGQDADSGSTVPRW